MTATRTPLTPEEAREALAAIEATTRKMRRMVAYGGMPYYLIIWGLVWVFGFSISHFAANSAMVGWAWLALDLLGLLSTFYVSFRIARTINYPQGAMVGWLWIVLLFYAALIVYFAQPRTVEQIGLLFSLFAMLGYVLTGILFRSRFMAYLGLTVTLFILIGYLFLSGFYYLWMAVLGGGSLVAAGVYILWAWR